MEENTQLISLEQQVRIAAGILVITMGAYLLITPPASFWCCSRDQDTCLRVLLIPAASGCDLERCRVLTGKMP